MNRNTLRAPLTLRGLGLHSGEPVTVTMRPGGDGIAFHYRGERVPAVPANVTGTSRCTRLGPVSTVEHLMSALACTQITDLEISVTAPELPGLDGSALPYVQALLATGLRPLAAAPAPRLRHPVRYTQGATYVEARAGTGRWTCVYHLEGHWLGVQSLTVRLPGDHPDHIAPARTLVLAEEIPAARAHRLGRGLGPDSVVVIGAQTYEGPVRFSDEPVRHKMLDLIGDLYLTGIPPAHLDVTAHRSGHQANVRLAQALTDALVRPRRIPSPVRRR
ncbi:UDP-3-O-acyl-N-acetylglucosamine deacetylase [Streptomyces sp. NPDC002343]